MARVRILASLLVALTLLSGCATTSGASTASAPQPFQVQRSGKGRPLVFIPGLASSGDVWSETVAADAPELVGGVVIVDSLPFLPAAMDPSATVDSMRPRAEEMRTLMRMQTVEQRGMQSRMALRNSISDAAKVDVAARWGAASDAETVNQAIYELSTTDLRPELSRITAPTLVLGSWIALKGLVPREAVEAVYRSQYAKLPTGRVVMSDTARHFIMWDDPEGFFRELDTFLAVH